jgi:ABC-type lipoprotein export system ATPase subunit
MAMRCGVNHVLVDEPTGAIDVRSTIAIVLFISTIEVSIGAVHVPMTPTSVRIVITTMQMVVTHAQIIPMTMAIVLSMTTLIDLMLYSTRPIKMSDYTLV